METKDIEFDKCSHLKTDGNNWWKRSQWNKQCLQITRRRLNCVTSSIDNVDKIM